MRHSFARPASTTLQRPRGHASGILAPAILASMMSFLHPATATGAEHEVTVWSFVTEHGRAASRPTDDQPVGCRLFSAGYAELGRVSSDPPSPAPSAEAVRDVLVDGLQSAGFRLAADFNSGEHAVVYQWGYMDPGTDASAAGQHSRREWRAMLALLGGPAALRLDVERAALADALREDRYFLVVSAYDSHAFVTTRQQRLLWRAHMSVPAHDLTHEQALPLLVGAGAAFFHRDLAEPRRIMIPLRPGSILRLKPAFR